MALTPPQKKWAVGGTIAAGALAVGWFIHRRSAQAATLSGGPPFLSAGPSSPGLAHGRHEHRKKLRRPEDFPRENERGEYGRKHHHHHRGYKHD